MKTIREDPSIAELETRLSESLTPVDPRPEFVRDLKGRLTQPEAHMHPAPSLFRLLVYAIAGLASLVLLIIAGVRGAPRLFVALHQIRRPASVEAPAPLTPAI